MKNRAHYGIRYNLVNALNRIISHLGKIHANEIAAIPSPNEFRIFFIGFTLKSRLARKF